MYLRKVFLVVLFSIITVKRTYCKSPKGYYWRDYYGIVPSDALEGGTDCNGNPIYIGQILHDNKLITAKIYKNDNRAYYVLLFEEYNGTNNVKILCTQEPEDFYWVPTEAQKIHIVGDDHLVRGGYEPGYDMYVGRVRHDCELAVGKILTSPKENLGIFVGFGGKEFNYKVFEILTHHITSNFSIETGLQ